MPPSINLILTFESGDQARAYRALVKNRLGLGAVIYKDSPEKVHVMGDDFDGYPVGRQAIAFAEWCKVRKVTCAEGDGFAAAMRGEDT
jgi:hypothetical protein